MSICSKCATKSINREDIPKIIVWNAQTDEQLEKLGQVLYKENKFHLSQCEFSEENDFCRINLSYSRGCKKIISRYE